MTQNIFPLLSMTLWSTIIVVFKSETKKNTLLLVISSYMGPTYIERPYIYIYRERERKRKREKLSIIWKSDLIDKMKRSFFQAAFTSILLYGCTTWTLTKRLEKKLDANYTRVLRAILNKSWRQYTTNTPTLLLSNFHHENYPS